ncbi:Nop52-domain-containing protein [Tuber magnatum]|uniref:Nop52-domain-containing protein n=1 Tax=Tuber magnatum TaxID=42249 RepID=A0A317SX07_9PEZI|nr:Nop52-domain-containing protein [Tuber magnatum]
MTETKFQKTPFVKQLAANDRPTRDRAVASLRTYLSSRRNFTKIEFLKLWKGLFYCMWLSDRPRTQQRLVLDLAGLLDSMETKNAGLFLEAFWITIAREWNGVDVLRMDKFLLLVRGYLASSFRYQHARKWEKDLVGRFMDLLREIPLSPKDMKVPNGLRYHLIDIYVDELEKLKREEMKAPLPIAALLSPFEELVLASPTKLVRTRSKELLCDGRLAGWGYCKAPGAAKSQQEEDAEGEDGSDGEEMDDEGEEWGGIDD